MSQRATLARMVTSIDLILAEVTTLRQTVDDTVGMEASDRRELKRRINSLATEADALLSWVCDQRDFDHPHN